MTIVAKHRGTSPEQLCKLMRTDLDWIVMKTLEKDRRRRYESVGEFAADIRRHLDNEPVHAGRTSTAYRIQKFVRRNRVLVTSATFVLVILMFATGISLWQMIRANHAAAQLAVEKESAVAAKQTAQEAQQIAKTAEQKEAQLRVKAEEQELAARLRAYAADKSETNVCWDVSACKQISSCTVDEAAPRVTTDLFLGSIDKNTLTRLEVLIPATSISQNVCWWAVKRRSGLSVYNLLTGQQAHDLITARVGASCLALFPEGQRVATAGFNAPIINMWDVPTQQIVHTVQGYNRTMHDIVISPDGRRMATSSLGVEPIKLWDTTSLEEVGSLDLRPGATLYRPMFLSDGNTLAAVEWDLENATDSFRLWQAPSWAEIEAADDGERNGE